MARKLDLPANDLVARYCSGETMFQLGSSYRTSYTTVRNRLLAAGVKFRARGARLGSKYAPRKKHWHKPGGPLSDTTGGYRRSYDRNGRAKYLHRGCWEAYHGTIPDGYVIHHMNGERTDNRIENLVLMSNEEHGRMHSVR